MTVGGGRVGHGPAEPRGAGYEGSTPWTGTP